MTRLLVILCLLWGWNPVAAEQYRTKLLINPNQALGESVELSVEQLEAEFGQMQDAFARSSAGRHLARHYVQQKQYQKAVDYYQQALAAEGLSPLLNQSMIKELATVYLLMDKPKQAVSSLQQLGSVDQIEDTELLLLYAQASEKSGLYLESAAILDRLLALNTSPDEAFLKQILALSYAIGQYERSQWALSEMIQHNPTEPKYWFQLAGLLVKQDKKKDALSVLLLAQAEGFQFTEQHTLLLSDLHASQGAPYKAAQVLNTALEQSSVQPKPEYYRRLFEYQLQAKESEAALASLAKAARLSGDIELYLYWAQLLMQQQSWQQMNKTVVEACQQPLDKRFVGQANVLLGISQLKLGRKKDAKNSFLNATLIGGMNDRAGQWLEYMGESSQAGVAKSSISGPCKPKA